MTTKSTTQKLNIRWQDRSWQPVIRQLPVPDPATAGSAKKRAVRRIGKPVVNHSAAARPPVCRSRKSTSGHLLQRIFSSISISRNSRLNNNRSAL